MIPFNYQDINSIAGRYKPSTQKSYNNETFAYWERALFQRAAYAIKLTLPEIWQNDLRGVFTFWLHRIGFLGIYRDESRGVVFQPGTVSGYDFYYRPTRFIVANPTINRSLELEIGKDVSVIKLSPDYLGTWDIIDFYARKLADLSLSVDLSVINTRFAKILGARNKAAAETLKKILDLVNQGQPAVVYDQKLLDDRTDKAAPFQEFGIDHLKENYITGDLLRDMQTVLNAFDNEIGIPTVPYQKQERMVTAEAQSRKIDSVARVTVWIQTLNDCFNEANQMFGLNLKAELRVPEGEVNGNVEVNDIISV